MGCRIFSKGRLRKRRKCRSTDLNGRRNAQKRLFILRRISQFTKLPLETVQQLAEKQKIEA